MDKDKPDWRETSVCVMDNAGYNRDPLTEEYIKKQKVPMVFSAKYSYSASPCEFFFSYFKKGLIYESETKTGKL